MIYFFYTYILPFLCCYSFVVTQIVYESMKHLVSSVQFFLSSFLFVIVLSGLFLDNVELLFSTKQLR